MLTHNAERKDKSLQLLLISCAWEKHYCMNDRTLQACSKNVVVWPGHRCGQIHTVGVVKYII